MITPSANRLTEQQKLAYGLLLLLAFSFLWLVPVDLGVLGAPWPAALLWPAVGWISLGPRISFAILLLVSGLFLDLLTGGPMGAWALCATATYGAGLIFARIYGRPDFLGLFIWFLGAGFFWLMSLIVGALTGGYLAPIAMIIPLGGALALFPFMTHFFVTERL